jgi:hypothetical protein
MVRSHSSPTARELLLTSALLSVYVGLRAASAAISLVVRD